MGLICGHFSDIRLYEQRPTVFCFLVICEGLLKCVSSFSHLFVFWMFVSHLNCQLQSSLSHYWWLSEDHLLSGGLLTQ